VADGGTIFLDEVGEIPLELQGKLLRVLQEGQFSMVGEDEQRQVDVRVIAATNRNLTSEAAAGTFRKDLYYRLSVFPIVVPPLRDRKEDILPLAQHFLRLATSKRDTTGIILRKKDLQALMAYDWPGNIRELQNVIERAVITASAGRLSFDLPTDAHPKNPSPADAQPSTEETAIITDDEMRRRERENVLAALKRTKWKLSGEDGAAELLGIKPTTLASRMKKMGIERPV
jgi:transcriptional regulator with GAF, ATPase, and Fis domain